MILVVDDDDDVRATILDTLDTLSYPSRGVATAGEAVAAVRTGSFSLGILDYKLPDLTGAVLAQELKRIKPDFKVIFATGYGDAEAMEAMGQDWPILQKPFNLAKLGELIEVASTR